MNCPERNGQSERFRSAAAFFDLDGTLLDEPSLERRFFMTLRYQRAIPPGSYWRWLWEAARRAPAGFEHALRDNKFYLRGVRIDRAAGSWFYLPRFFEEALTRLEWHAREGHHLFLVSGTLAPLAELAARALAAELAAAGVPKLNARFGVAATRLEQHSGRWTGRVLGDRVVREAKARAVRQAALESGFDLGNCFGYGDSADDRCFLELVGKPAAVNPSPDLDRIARERGWPRLDWRAGRPQ